jgi:16S rRNA U516 pseudouridylate synthase RsuA-like enzyme
MINNLKAIEKEFEAKIKGVTDEKTLEQMKKGILREGFGHCASRNAYEIG